MKILHKLCLAWLVVSLTGLAAAQSDTQLKKELKTREASVTKTDADGLVELARWSRDKGLLKDYKRLLQKAIKADPDHEGANTELGMVKVEGEWVTRAKAAILQEKALDASMKEKGLVKIDEVWVDKEHADDAKKGVFWHEGERVSKFEKRALASGQVRHPRTGTFIDAADLARAEQGLFPTGNGQWLAEEEANKFHKDRENPWVIRTNHATLVGTMPIAKLEEFKNEVDVAIESVLPVFLNKHPDPGHRPVVFGAENSEEYRYFGSEAGGAGSAYGAFFAEPTLDIPGIGPCNPAFFDGTKGWAPYYCRHAAALALAHGHFAAAEAKDVDWFLRGVGSLAGRFLVPSQTANLGRQHIQKGGVKQLKTWFNSFGISGEMEPKTIDYNIFQAGLVLHFAMKGGDEESLKAIQAVSEALTEKPKNLEKALKTLRKVLSEKDDEVRKHLETLTRE